MRTFATDTMVGVRRSKELLTEWPAQQYLPRAVPDLRPSDSESARPAGPRARDIS